MKSWHTFDTTATCRLWTPRQSRVSARLCTLTGITSPPPPSNRPGCLWHCLALLAMATTARLRQFLPLRLIKAPRAARKAKMWRWEAISPLCSENISAQCASAMCIHPKRNGRQKAILERKCPACACTAAIKTLNHTCLDILCWCDHRFKEGSTTL